MTTTDTTTETAASTRVTPMITAGQATALVAAPLTAVVSRLLMTPQYQDDADRPDSAHYLADLAAAPVRNGIGAVLMLLSAILFLGTAVVLTGIARRRMRRVGLAGGVLTAIGAVGLAGTSAQVVAAGVMADAPERDAMAALWSTMYTAPSTNIYFLALLFGSAGAVLVAVALYRLPGIPRSAAVLGGIGTAAVWPSSTGPAVVFVTGAAVLCLAGLAWVAVSARRITSG